MYKNTSIWKIFENWKIRAGWGMAKRGRMGGEKEWRIVSQGILKKTGESVGTWEIVRERKEGSRERE